MRFSFLTVTALVLPLITLPTIARAAIVLTLDTPVISAASGTTATFTGSLVNTGNAEAFLNQIGFQYVGGSEAFLTGDDAPFFANVPLSLAPSGTAGDTYAGTLFGVTVAPGTPDGTYLGSVTFLGGDDDTASDTLASQSYGVAVTVVPEAGALPLLIGGLGGAAFVRARRGRVGR